MARTTQNSSHRAIERYVTGVSQQGGILTYLPVVVNNSMTVNGNLVGFTAPVTALTASTATVTAAQSGTVFTLGRAAGITVTLPTPAAGLEYTFNVVTAASGGSYKIVTATPASQFLQGVETTSAGVDGDGVTFQGDGATDVSYNMNGTTTGGLVGATVTFTGLSSTLWQVTASNFGSGTLATSFATS